MDFCVQRLNDKAWIHIFPEGKVNVTKEWLRLKWGLGRLIAEPSLCPLVLPMWLAGFDDVLPNTEPVTKVPRLFRDVTIVVGRPLDLTAFRDDVLAARLCARDTRKVLTDKVEEELKVLRQLTSDLHGNVPGSLERYKLYLSSSSSS
jgi:monolysocardiolipin acyltransferase